MGLRRRTKREAARAELQCEAAEIINGRIADGRPPPEVWRAAADRQAKKGLPADAWYRPAGSAARRLQPVSSADRAVSAIGRDFVLQVVRLPLSPPAAMPRRGATTPRAAADAN